MPLSTPHLPGSPNDDVFASDDLASVLPKKHFPRHEHDPKRIYQAVRDELLLDGNSRQNLAICRYPRYAGTWFVNNVFAV